MVEAFIVSAEDELGRGYLDQRGIARFADVKRRVLGYTEASRLVPTGTGAFQDKSLPLGACRDAQDGQQLITALAPEFPEKRFQSVRVVYEDANSISWL